MSRTERISQFPPQRLYDLVRYCRGELHEEGLITDREYAEMASWGSASARRLEDYDEAVATLRIHNADLLQTLKHAYRKHHLNQDYIPWNELSDRMCDTLCNVMGDRAFQLWLEGVSEPKEE